jgi:phosphate ABC transporter phosphate-binding protein
MMPAKSTCALAALILTACVCIGCRRGSSQEGRLTGGGSSFVNPIMTKWAGVYLKEKGIRVDYTSSGSGNGVQQMIDQKNDFGCTDAPMNPEELKKAQGVGGDTLHIPLVMGGVVPAYNLDGIDKPLRFTGPVLADIFLGKITHWNDARLKELNPGVALPDLEIAVIHRSDSSGTTYIWAEYLAKVSKAWQDQVGVGTDLQWPKGVGAPKNDGVAGQISRTHGALGYVELIYVLRNKIQFGSVRNQAGEFVLASLDSITRAAEGALTNIPEDLRYSLNDAPGKEAYPICGTTWAVLYRKQPPQKARLLASFFHWLTHEGQEYTAELQYARLSRGLVERVERQLELLRNSK